MSTAHITRTDPLRDFKFRVKIIPPVATGGTGTSNSAGQTASLGSLISGIDKIGFAVVSGISVQNEMIPYREGGMNTHPHKMVGLSDFAPVTFSRGVFANQPQMWKWQTFMHAWMQGNGVSGGSTGQYSDYRCDIEVSVMDHPYTSSNGYVADPSAGWSDNATFNNERLKFTLYNCWPGGYALSDLNAGASSIMVQQMTIHHEGFEISFNNGNTNNSNS